MARNISYALCAPARTLSAIHTRSLLLLPCIVRLLSEGRPPYSLPYDSRLPHTYTLTSVLSQPTMADLGAQLGQLTPEQRQAIMVKAQQEANQTVMQEMMKRMVASCFDKCTGTSVRKYH